MRPVRLRFSGLRSYRAETEIDFGDLDLFAVIGDTGAGKSTLIEALCLALYARKSWSGGEAGLADMITDGVNTMRIELTFVAADHEWTVTRARHRNSSSPVDRLVSSTGGVGADGAKAVTSRITELIGLTYEQFTRAVVLPQGRFDSLLRAGERERNQILTSILDLGDVVATRARAEALSREWSPRTHAWTAVREQLPSDPAGNVEAATAAVGTASERDRRLGEAVARAERLAVDLAADVEVRRDLGAALAEVRPPTSSVASDLAALRELWVRLDKLGEETSAELDAAAERLAALDTRVGTVLRGAPDRDALVAASAVAARVADELPDAITALDVAASALDALGSSAPDAAVDSTLAEAVERAAAALVDADARRRAAERAIDVARSARRAVAAALERVVVAESAVVDLERRLATGRELTTTAETEVKAGAELLAVARASEHTALLADAAATAASDCAAGDDCPVCSRPLPDDFEPPTPSDGVAAARAAVTAATADLERRHEEAKRIDHQLVRLGGELPVRTEELEVARRAVVAAESEASDAGVVIDALDDAAALAVVTAAAIEAAAVATAVGAEHTAAATALAESRAAAAVAVESHRKDVERATRAHAAAVAMVNKLRALAVDLPGQWSDEIVVDPIVELATSVVSVRASIAAAVAELQAVERDRATEVTAVHTAERRSDELGRRRSEEVRRPVDRVLGEINESLATVARVESVARTAGAAVSSANGGVRAGGAAEPEPDLDLDLTPLGPVGLPDDLDLRAHEVEARVTASTALVAHASALLASLDERSTTADAALAELLRSVACESVGMLHQQRGEAGRDLAAAEEALAVARTAAEQAAALDAVLAIAAPFVANVSALAAALRDQHFIAHLVDAREQELLTEASRRLKDISAGRFGFVSDFGIVDVSSGEVRTPDTLSGGERFQAALALALGLVEIASRGRGRLDAVFVDEGFGSLDGNALDDALATLGKVAGGGKMVALISHLRHVAESVDTVLLVTKDDLLGSRLERLDVDQREELLADDIRSGLTS